MSTDLLVTPTQAWVILYLALVSLLVCVLLFQYRTHQRLEALMALVQVDQTVLDSFGTELGTIADAVQAIVDDPGNPLADADVSAITAAVARLQAAVAAPETPVEPPVEPAAEA